MSNSNSRFLGYAVHTDLLSHFLNSIKDLNKSNIIQVSIDGPSVNLKFYTELVKTWQEAQLTSVDIGTCSLHVIHGAFETAIESSNWEMKNFLKGNIAP